MSRLPACGHEAFRGDVGTGSPSGNAPANNQIGARTYGSVKSILTSSPGRQAAINPFSPILLRLPGFPRHFSWIF
jgi:hypothetical protein